MQSDWAAENLQVIRTLMERSAVYRRALAPMTLFAGSLGTVAALVGWALELQAPRPFILYWLGVAVVALLGVSFLARRGAIQAGEPFWSPPTRRVARAALPALGASLVMTLGVLVGLQSGDDRVFKEPLALGMMPTGWITLYGLALNAAGFFMPRGIQFLGWIFIAGGGVSFVAAWANVGFVLSGHWLMGLHFGLLHLAYGSYLLLTEKALTPP